MTAQEASALVAALMAYYPGMTFPVGSVAAYEAFLLELEHDRGRAAVRQVIRTCKFFPSVAEIVAAYDALAPSKGQTPYRRYLGPKHSGPVMSPTELRTAVDAFLADSDAVTLIDEDFS